MPSLCRINSPLPPPKTLRECGAGLLLYRILHQALVVVYALCQIRATLGWGEHGGGNGRSVPFFLRVSVPPW
jgi:hypothetical protein